MVDGSLACRSGRGVGLTTSAGAAGSGLASVGDASATGWLDAGSATGVASPTASAGEVSGAELEQAARNSMTSRKTGKIFKTLKLFNVNPLAEHEYRELIYYHYTHYCQ